MYEEKSRFPILENPLHVELIVYFNNQAVAMRFYNDSNIGKLLKGNCEV